MCAKLAFSFLFWQAESNIMLKDFHISKKMLQHSPKQKVVCIGIYIIYAFYMFESLFMYPLTMLNGLLRESCLLLRDYLLSGQRT